MIEQTVTELTPMMGTAPACQALGMARSTIYRWRKPRMASHPEAATAPAVVFEERSRLIHESPRALSPAERAAVLDMLRSPRFVDCSPSHAWAALLDEGRYLCSVRTMYRLLAAHGEVRERRAQLTHPAYAKPELLADRANTLWSWDITKLLGPAKWTYYYLYVLLDVYSRYVVGWTIQHREAAGVAKAMIEQAIDQQQVPPNQLTVHADRGGPMRSKPVAFLLADLSVTKTHSRPYTSTDNPYSEAQFKTMKYRPDFPDRFGSIEHARDFGRRFFHWYNHEHRHSGIGLLTPAVVHDGRAEEIYAERARILAAAHAAHPERFIRGAPRPPELPTAAWINKPSTQEAAH